MSFISFHAIIREGLIEIPDEYRDALPQQVRVIVLPEAITDNVSDAIGELLAHPIECPDFRLLARESIYERR